MTQNETILNRMAASQALRTTINRLPINFVGLIFLHGRM